MNSEATAEATSEGSAAPWGAWPAVPLEAWRTQALRELQGAALERLGFQGPDGLRVEPLYASTPTELPGRALLLAAVGWTVCTEYAQPDAALAAAAIAEDLRRGTQGLWISLDERQAAGVAGPPAPVGLHGVVLRGADDLARLFAGVEFEGVSITLAVGAAGRAVAGWLRPEDAARLRGTLGCDPLGALARGGALAWPIEHALQDMSHVAGWARAAAPGLRTALVDVGAYHDAGASAGEQIGVMLATGAAYLRTLSSDGASVAGAARQMAFAAAVGRDLFLEIGKLRAMRLAWARVVAACGGDAAAQRMHLHARGSWRERTAIDPWVGLLRGTGETFAAAVGGADSISTTPMDAALGEPGELGRRMALNTQLVLAEEAQLGRVADPAGGAGYVEALTDQLARAGWARFQAIERAGGMARALRDGLVQGWAAASAKVQAQAVASVRAPIVGVSRFPAPHERPTGARPARELLAEETGASGHGGEDRSGGTGGSGHGGEDRSGGTGGSGHVGEDRSGGTGGSGHVGEDRSGGTGGSGHVGEDRSGAAWGLREGGFGPAREVVGGLVRARLAEPFEALRRRSGGDAVALVAVGEPAQWRGRVEFCRAYFAVGGFVAIETAGAVEVEDVARQFAETGARAAVICSADPVYAAVVPMLVPRLRAAGAATVLVAGRPKEQVEALTAAGVDLFVQLGGDAVALLGELQRRLEVGP